MFFGGNNNNLNNIFNQNKIKKTNVSGNNNKPGNAPNEPNGTSFNNKKTVNVTKSNLMPLNKNNFKFFKSIKNEPGKPTLAISSNIALPSSISNHFNKNSSSIPQLFPINNSNKKYRVNSRILEKAKTGKLTKKNSNAVNIQAVKFNTNEVKSNVTSLITNLHMNKPNTSGNNISSVGGKVMYNGRNYSVKYGVRGGRYIHRGGRKMYF